MIIQGKAFRYGDNINTDLILPARYLTTPDAQALAEHCMEDIDPSFVRQVKPGDIIVAGENFGCGSSREHAPMALKACGVSFIISRSFARIFYRNAINIGLAIIENPEAADGISAGDKLRIDTENGCIIDETTGGQYAMPPFPPFLQQIIQAGGLLAAVREALP